MRIKTFLRNIISFGIVIIFSIFILDQSYSGQQETPAVPQVTPGQQSTTQTPGSTGPQQQPTQTQPQTTDQATNQNQPQNNEPQNIPPDPNTSVPARFYREIKLNTDLTLELVKPLNQNEILNDRSFLVTNYQPDTGQQTQQPQTPQQGQTQPPQQGQPQIQNQPNVKLQSIACYDKNKELSLYILDKPLNMYFYYITFEYKDDELKLITLRDITDQKLWEIRYFYSNTKKIVKSEVYKRETETGELFLVFFNQYRYYYNGKIFVHSLYNKRSELEERTYYMDNENKKRYERYMQGGKELQYFIIYSYDGITDFRVYSPTNVLLKVVDKPASRQVQTPQTEQQPTNPQPTTPAQQTPPGMQQPPAGENAPRGNP